MDRKSSLENQESDSHSEQTKANIFLELGDRYLGQETGNCWDYLKYAEDAFAKANKIFLKLGGEENRAKVGPE